MRINYDEHKAVFMKENRRLWIALIVCVGITSATLAISAMRLEVRKVISADLGSESEAISLVCQKAMESIFKGKPDKRLISSDIVKTLKKEPFILEDFRFVSSGAKGDECRVITESRGELYNFQISLIKDLSAPMHYKITDVVETRI